MKKEPSYKGKRFIENGSNKKRFLIPIIIVIMIVTITVICICLCTKKDNEYIATNTDESNTIMDESLTQEDTMKEDEIVDVSELPEKMGNYKVIGELVIDKINLKKNILEKTDDSSLNLSVTKFYGPEINTVGNFCITGHNYKNLLKRQGELEVGDTFYLINKETKTKVTYKIYNVYTCNPNDVDCLYPPTEEIREATLITCNPGGTTRLICKAKEI